MLHLQPFSSIFPPPKKANSARKDQILKGLAEGEANSDFVPIEVAVFTEIHILGKKRLYMCI
jgi:hypothetical protein